MAAPLIQRAAAVVGVCILALMLYLNYGYYNRHMEEQPVGPVHSYLDAYKCKSLIAGSPVEISETTSTINGKLAGQCRLKNLHVMPDPTHVDDSVLVMVVYNNAESWGKGRSVHNFIDLVKLFDYPLKKISLGILTSSPDEYHALKDIFTSELRHTPSFAQSAASLDIPSSYRRRVSLVLRQDFSIDVSRDGRKADNVQKERRRMLARYRNYALTQSLEPWHVHVVWIDSDIVEIPSALVSKMVHGASHMFTNLVDVVVADKDVLEPICFVQGTEAEYDLNAWRGNRAVPTADELHAMHQGKLFVPHDGPGMVHINHVRDHEYYPLDSVGGTMLYVKADIHRQGVLFATHYVIGSEWKHEGYDGIETEGLCYVAGMLGYKCWAMPQDVIYHASN
ncbi:Aste57867_11965 [Aphanomyces stellatus]|uniref:Aste57867_11965 protein n=1 Tax=Aphanomyces stellatus TaxID=120398 RepID=A0A485KUU1_9STRA|nr:hypothetical protein As57867_011920 [Aphanomyces stellatus]VFT88820.1 Aste57867_11965 [Aphanomyces stellatus]